MAKKPDKRKRDDPEQSRRFEETARDVGADDTSALERAMDAIVRDSKKKQKTD